MSTYVAFLRGINVGGNKKVAMADLKKMLEKMKYTNVHTLLNSGNIVFDGPTTSLKTLNATLEAQFEQTFGFTSAFIVRPMSDIEKLIKLDPFKNITVTKDVRLYVSFLPDTPKSILKIPYVSPEKDFQILAVADGEICSVLDLSKGSGTVDAMGILEKAFGKNMTTRNWNTVMKLAQMKG